MDESRHPDDKEEERNKKKVVFQSHEAITTLNLLLSSGITTLNLLFEL